MRFGIERRGSTKGPILDDGTKRNHLKEPLLNPLESPYAFVQPRKPIP